MATSRIRATALKQISMQRAAYLQLYMLCDDAVNMMEHFTENTGIVLNGQYAVHGLLSAMRRRMDKQQTIVQIDALAETVRTRPDASALDDARLQIPAIADEARDIAEQLRSLKLGVEAMEMDAHARDERATPQERARMQQLMDYLTDHFAADSKATLSAFVRLSNTAPRTALRQDGIEESRGR